MKMLMAVAGLLCGSLVTVAHAAEVEARIEWSRRTELAMPVSGVVTEVLVDAGARVGKGQTLVSLDPAPFQTGVNEATAQLARRRIERDEATRDARQAKELYERTVLSTVELENANNKLARAEAAYKEAAAHLDRARYRQRMSVLRAPFDAIVLSRRVEVGQSLSAELSPPTAMVIAASGEYLAQTRLGAERATTLKPGLEVQVSVGGKKYPGKIRSVSFDSSAGKDAYVLDVVFSTQDLYAAGQAARVTLP